MHTYIMLQAYQTLCPLFLEGLEFLAAEPLLIFEDLFQV